MVRGVYKETIDLQSDDVSWLFKKRMIFTFSDMFRLTPIACYVIALGNLLNIFYYTASL